jgi:hypothetical protein
MFSKIFFVKVQIFINMAKKLENLRENLFTELGKLIVTAALKYKLTMGDVKGDQDLNTTLESLKFHTSEYERKLKSFCDRWPDDKKCKDRKERK